MESFYSFFRIFFIAAALTGMVLGTQASAQQMTVDLSKLPPDVSATLLKAQQAIAQQEKAATATVVQNIPTVTQAEQWSNVGQNLANAIGAVAKTLSIEVNDFVKTPVGWWAFAFIFWYFLGNTFWHIIGGCLVWLTLGVVVWHSFRIFHIPTKRLVSEENKIKKYEYVKYEFKSDDARTMSACVHVGAFVLVSIAMLIIIF